MKLSTLTDHEIGKHSLMKLFAGIVNTVVNGNKKWKDIKISLNLLF